MPSVYAPGVLTNDGIALLEKAIAGDCEIQFTSITTGDGTYTAEERTVNALQSLTELKSLKQTTAVTTCEYNTETQVKVAATISNTTLVSGYYMNEVGLMARKKDDPTTEILYAISLIDENVEKGDYMPPYNGSNPAAVVQAFYIQVDNAENVTIEATLEGYALQGDMEQVLHGFRRTILNDEGKHILTADGKAIAAADYYVPKSEVVLEMQAIRREIRAEKLALKSYIKNNFSRR